MKQQRRVLAEMPSVLTSWFIFSFLMMPCFCTAEGPGSSANAERQRRNVVVVIGDDTGRDMLSVYGDSVARTPAATALAKRSTVFERAYATTPSCSASRGTLLTGLHSHANGQYGHSHNFNHFTTFSTVKSLPRLLSDAGVRTAMFGKFHVAPADVYPFDRLDEGHDLPGGHRNTVAQAKRAAQWISESPEEPFFLYFATFDPHEGGPGPFGNGLKGRNPYPDVDPVRFKPTEIHVPDWLSDKPKVRQELANYYQSMNRVDQGLAKLVAELERLGKLDETMIIFTSDHGPPFPGAKTTLYETGVLIPLIVYTPEHANSPVRTDALVSMVDLCPTILDYFGVEPPVTQPVRPSENGHELPKVPDEEYKFHGRSLLPNLGTTEQLGRDEVLLSHTFHQVNMYDPMRAIVQDRWKLIYNLSFVQPQGWAMKLFDPKRPLEAQNIGKRPLRPFLLRDQLQLFDLDNDPLETTNLAHDPSSVLILASLTLRC